MAARRPKVNNIEGADATAGKEPCPTEHVFEPSELLSANRDGGWCVILTLERLGPPDEPGCDLLEHLQEFRGRLGIPPRVAQPFPDAA